MVGIVRCNVSHRSIRCRRQRRQEPSVMPFGDFGFGKMREPLCGRTERTEGYLGGAELYGSPAPCRGEHDEVRR